MSVQVAHWDRELRSFWSAWQSAIESYRPMLALIKDSGKSLMWIRNNNGARIVPWETPDLTGRPFHCV